MNYEIEITRRCNFRCPSCNHLCNVLNDPTSDMTMDDVKSVIRQINAIDVDPGRVIVIGGEPTIHPQCAEICRYIKDNIRSMHGLFLDTNHTNPDVCKRCADIGCAIVSQDGSDDPVKIMANKINKHFNFYISPFEENLPVIDAKACPVLRGLGNNGTCGLSVHKYKGSLKWCWCPGGSSLCKLLGKEEFMYSTLSSLFTSDIDMFCSEICPHCMNISKVRPLAKDTPGKVSECFRQGLEKMIQYNAEVNGKEV